MRLGSKADRRQSWEVKSWEGQWRVGWQVSVAEEVTAWLAGSWLVAGLHISKIWGAETELG